MGGTLLLRGPRGASKNVYEGHGSGWGILSMKIVWHFEDGQALHLHGQAYICLDDMGFVPQRHSFSKI